VQFVLDGKKVLDALDKAYADDKLMARCLRMHRDVWMGPDQDKMFEMVFGKKIKAFKAEVTGDLKPLFDYKAEMEKAKAGQDAMVKKLGLDLTANSGPMPPVMKGNGPPPGP
jgi:hypothetical protein